MLIIESSSVYRLEVTKLSSVKLILNDRSNAIIVHLDTIDELIKALKTFQTKGDLNEIENY